MSWWGGSVPAGGIIAFLQSLGAKGLASFASTYAGKALLAAGCLELKEVEVCSLTSECHRHIVNWRIVNMCTDKNDLTDSHFH